MARPRRPAAERDAVRALALPNLSARCNAGRIARGVVAAFLADLARDDAMERALFDVQHRLEPDPLHSLATMAEGGVGERFRRERMARFEGRDCRQLSPTDWQAETESIAATVTTYLARRYRDFLN